VLDRIYPDGCYNRPMAVEISSKLEGNLRCYLAKIIIKPFQSFTCRPRARLVCCQTHHRRSFLPQPCRLRRLPKGTVTYLVMFAPTDCIFSPAACILSPKDFDAAAVSLRLLFESVQLLLCFRNFALKCPGIVPLIFLPWQTVR